MSLVAIVVAVLALVTVYVLLRGTRFGLRLKAVGQNLQSSALFGIANTKYLLMAFASRRGPGRNRRSNPGHGLLSQARAGAGRRPWLSRHSHCPPGCVQGQVDRSSGVLLRDRGGWGIPVATSVGPRCFAGRHPAQRSSPVCTTGRRLASPSKRTNKGNPGRGGSYVNELNSLIAAAAPLVFAVVGETITEKAGIINLSLEGSLMLAAMTGFAVSFETNSLLLGFLAAAIVGMLVALLIAFSSISLKLNQVAVGFVLFQLCTDLSTFLGQAYVRIPGPSVQALPVPLLEDIPILGPLLLRSERGCLRQFRRRHSGLLVHVPNPAGSRIAGSGRATRSCTRPGYTGQPAALSLHGDRRIPDWRSRSFLFPGGQAGMVFSAHPEPRLDCSCDRYLWRVATNQSSCRSLSIRRTTHRWLNCYKRACRESPRSSPPFLSR